MQITTPTERAPRRPRWAPMAIAVVVGLALAALGVARWAGDDPSTGARPAHATRAATPATTVAPRPTPPPPAPEAAPAPAPAAATPHPTRPRPVLPDGRHPAYLTDVDAAGGTLQFDLVQYLDSEAAEQAYAAAHPGVESVCGCDPGPIRNDSHRLRRLPVAAGLVVTLEGRGAALCGYHRTVAYGALADELVRPVRPDHTRLTVNGFWLTVRGGTIVALDDMGCDEAEY